MTFIMHATTGKTTKHAASVPFDAAALLLPDDLPGFLADVMHDGDTRALPLALRTAADVLGMTELARRTGLSRESLYRSCPAKAIRDWTRWRRSCPRSGCG